MLVRREIDLEVVDEPEVPLVAEVERLADDAPAAEVGRLDAERAGEVGRQIRFRLLDRQPQVGDAEGHGGIITNTSPGTSCPGACIAASRDVTYDISFELMFTNVWMCGRARKLHTKPGPSSRQYAHGSFVGRLRLPGRTRG